MFVCLCKKEFSQRQNYNRHTLECDTFMAANHVCACGKTCINSQELLKHKEACNKNATVPQQLECQLTQLINNNPISVIPNEHYGLLISKIKEKFNHCFISFFPCHLKWTCILYSHSYLLLKSTFLNIIPLSTSSGDSSP